MNNLSIEPIELISIQLADLINETDINSKNDKIYYSEERLIKIKNIIQNFNLIPDSQGKSDTEEYILTNLEVLNSICEKKEISIKSLKNVIEHINGLIYVHFRRITFNDTDRKYFDLAGSLVKLFRNTKCLAAYRCLGITCYNIFIEENPIVFECLPQLSLAHLFFVSFSEPENVKSGIKKLQQICVSLLEDRIIQIQHKTFESLVHEGENIKNNIIPKLDQLFSVFRFIIDTLTSKNDGEPSDEIKICLYRKISQDTLSAEEEALLVSYAPLIINIKSISQIISSYNRAAFNSIMKLALCSEENLESLRN